MVPPMLILALTLLIPPVIPTPPELEVCILQAELCVAGQCSSEPERDQCIETYEDCSYAIPEAHIPSCRSAHVWCVLESSIEWSSDELEECKAIFAACPDPLSI